MQKKHLNVGDLVAFRNPKGVIERRTVADMSVRGDGIALVAPAGDQWVSSRQVISSWDTYQQQEAERSAALYRAEVRSEFARQERDERFEQLFIVCRALETLDIESGTGNVIHPDKGTIDVLFIPHEDAIKLHALIEQMGLQQLLGEQ
jgi:hypothetical protein